uniref:3'-phosphate/5'-hydroxy nucleic acid ligase n=1 Tax=Timema tahoe TaxID=61484 RepID=A0A7R9IFW1_9NEOP|nr:unnamed protein product [Timema tahoe]
MLHQVKRGSTRAFPPHHPLIPVDYQLTGQPVLIGGTMGTCSYVLTGTEQGMHETFGSTCHGAGRALSRAKSRRNLDYQDVLNKLEWTDSVILSTISLHLLTYDDASKPTLLSIKHPLGQVLAYGPET